MMVLDPKAAHTSCWSLVIVALIICHRVSRAEEVGIDNQNVNGTRHKDGQSDNGKIRQSGGEESLEFVPRMYSPPPPLLNRFRPLHFRPRRPIILEHHPHFHEYEPNYFPHRFPPPRPRLQLMEFPFKRRMDHQPIGSNRGGLVSNLVNKANQAFQNLITQTRNRSSSRLVKFMGSERRLSSSRLFSRLGNHRLNRMEMESKIFNNNNNNGNNPNNNSNNNNTDLQYAESRSQKDTEDQGAAPYPVTPENRTEQIDFAQEGQRLRNDIIDKLDHVKRVLNTAFEVSKERRDFLLGRILEQTNSRLERTKLRADQILSEPSTSELAVKTLHHINQGVNNMNLLLHTLLNRVDFSIKLQMKNPNNGTAPSQTDKREEH